MLVAAVTQVLLSNSNEMIGVKIAETKNSSILGSHWQLFPSRNNLVLWRSVCCIFAKYTVLKEETLPYLHYQEQIIKTLGGTACRIYLLFISTMLYIKEWNHLVSHAPSRQLPPMKHCLHGISLCRAFCEKCRLTSSLSFYLGPSVYGCSAREQDQPRKVENLWNLCTIGPSEFVSVPVQCQT